MQRVPFRPEEPPRNLPLLNFTCRPLIPEPFSEMMFQSSGPSRLLAHLRVRGVNVHVQESNRGVYVKYRAPTLRPYVYFPSSHCLFPPRARALGCWGPLPASPQLHILLCLRWIYVSALLLLDEAHAMTHPQTMKSKLLASSGREPMLFVTNAPDEGLLILRHLH